MSNTTNMVKIIHDSKKLANEMHKYNESELVYLLNDYNIELLLRLYNENFKFTDLEFNSLAIDLQKLKSSRYTEVLISMKYNNVNIHNSILKDYNKIKLYTTKSETYMMYNCIYMVKYLHSKNKLENSDFIFNKACELGYLDIVKFLYSSVQTHVDYDELFVYMCEINNLEIAQWIYYDVRINSTGNNKSFVLACKHGNIDMIEWLVSTGVDIYSENGEGIVNAYVNGHREATDFLYEMHISTDFFTRGNDFENLCKDDKLEMIKYVCDKAGKDIITVRSFIAACENGNLELAKFLYSYGDIDIDENYNLILSKICRHQNIVSWFSEL